jgi:hypothetical protein
VDLDQIRVKTNFDILNLAAGARRAELCAALAKASAMKVQGGLFTGMILSGESSWHDGDLAPKILGCYEEELIPAFTRAMERNPPVVVNIGCAEGYYAVGLARALPQARVFAHDTDASSRQYCQRAAAANGVGARVVVDGLCTNDTLRRHLAGPGRALLVLDCEGAEMTLLDPAPVPELCDCDIIVECHDFMNRDITETLMRRFAGTHQVEKISEGPRDPNRFPVLRHMSSLDRWLAVNEGRPETMYWLACWAD